MGNGEFENENRFRFPHTSGGEKKKKKTIQQPGLNHGTTSTTSCLMNGLHFAPALAAGQRPYTFKYHVDGVGCMVTIESQHVLFFLSKCACRNADCGSWAPFELAPTTPSQNRCSRTNSYVLYGGNSNNQNLFNFPPRNKKSKRQNETYTTVVQRGHHQRQAGVGLHGGCVPCSAFKYHRKMLHAES